MKKAFTIVEVMILVVIVGLLAALAIPAFQKVRENSWKEKAKIERISLEEYKYRHKLMTSQESLKYKQNRRQGETFIEQSVVTKEFIINGHRYILAE